MFQKFFTNTIESKFIQNLLYNSYIPIYDTIDIGDKVIKDKIYVYKHYIIKATKTCGFTDEGFNRDYVILDHYNFGEKNKQYVKNYISKNNYYDEQTHRYLGDYLRCYRDIYGIDLMPFYNCFNYYHIKNSSKNIFLDAQQYTVNKELPGSTKALYPGETSYPGNEVYPSGSTVELTKTRFVVTEGENTDNLVYLVPIKFNRTYTIALDSPTPICVKGILANDNGLLKETEDLNDSGLFLSMARFNDPFTYTIETQDKDLFNKQRYLYLLLQLSPANNSSIVVLEGDYTHNKVILDGNGCHPIEYVMNFGESITDKQYNAALLSELSLLQMNDTNIYAFSDKLVEYLLQNVITQEDELGGNIKRTQDNLNNVIKLYTKNNKAEYNTKAHYGIWDNKIRYNAYNYYMKKDKKHNLLDINGFIDSNIEDFLISNSNRYKKQVGD